MNELEWLRQLEEKVRDIRRTDKYSEQMTCVAEVRQMINQRIIVLLEECSTTKGIVSCRLKEGHIGPCELGEE